MEGEPVTVTATLDKALTDQRSELHVPIELTAGTAEDGDFRSPLRYIEVPAGATTGTLEVQTRHDGDTDDETFKVSLPSQRPQVGKGETSEVWVTIVDDGRASTYELSVSDAVAEETSLPPSLLFAVTLNRAASYWIVVNYRTEDITAQAGLDYVGVLPSWGYALIFEPGETRKIVRVPVIDDTIEDSGETLKLVLFNPQGVELRNPEGVGTIFNDDPPPGGSIPGGSPPSGSPPSGSTPRPNDGNDNNGKNPVDPNGLPLPVPQSDLRPSFGDITVGDQSYTQGMEIAPLMLPAGTGGNGPLTYTLTPALPAGLMLDMATRYLSGTPSMPQEARQYTWTATDADGDTTTLEFSIAVAAAPEPRKVAAQEWPIRFGRTVSQQVMDALQSRFTTSPQPGLHLTVAGEELNGAVPLAENRSALAKLLGFETLTSHQLVQDSSFSFSPSVSAPHFSFWGEGALSSFSGKAATVTLDGDVTTALLGAEWNAERWQAGAALSRSWGNGGYEAENGMEGEISTTMTGLYPYGRYALSPRLGIWASAGYGWGTLSLTSEGTTYNPSAKMTMAAAGMDGLLLDGGAEGLSLSTIADVMTVKTTTDAVDGLAASEGNVSRFRLGLEAVRPFPLSNGASLLPSLSVGVRQDSGDAETGFGTELGAGVSWMDPQRGISADLKGRILLTHGSEDFQERGMALSFAWDPNPSNRGPSLSVSHALGAAATGGLDALLNPTTMEGLGADDGSREHQQFATRLAYGFPAFGDRLTVTPSLGLALSPYSSSTSLRWALTPYTGTGQMDEPWAISLEGQRQKDTTGSAPVDHSLELRFSLQL